MPFEFINESLIDQITRLLEQTKSIWPQYSIDGYRNIWIVKPGALSRGRGIIVFDKIENILDLNTSPLQKDGKYVIQKYIERPLLIHKIKFDIRQWFLVTDFNPLTIWMYKDCYLRFCTQKFTLDTTQQSVHLCNYSIQKNYKNDLERSEELPEENMWSNTEFKSKYLSKMNREDAWEELIYPGMKNAILSSMLSTQDIIESRKNTFELYGADFMIDESLKPWLIEINCSPTMARSTVVTTFLCDNVLEDVCKVTIDRKYNRNADTGRFELIYKGAAIPTPNYLGIDLKIDGHSFKKGTAQHSQSNSQAQTLPNINGSQAIKRTEPESLTVLGIDRNCTSKETTLKKDTKLINRNTSPPTATTMTTSPSQHASVVQVHFNRNSAEKKEQSELPSPSISIATSIHELAQKEQKNLNQLNDYHLSLVKEISHLDNRFKVKDSDSLLSKRRTNSINSANDLLTKSISNAPKVFQLPIDNFGGSDKRKKRYKMKKVKSVDYKNTNQFLYAEHQQQLNHAAQLIDGQSSISSSNQENNSSFSNVNNSISNNKGKYVIFKPWLFSSPNNLNNETRNLNRQAAFASYYASLMNLKKSTSSAANVSISPSYSQVNSDNSPEIRNFIEPDINESLANRKDKYNRKKKNKSSSKSHVNTLELTDFNELSTINLSNVFSQVHPNNLVYNSSCNNNKLENNQSKEEDRTNKLSKVSSKLLIFKLSQTHNKNNINNINNNSHKHISSISRKSNVKIDLNKSLTINSYNLNSNLTNKEEKFDQNREFELKNKNNDLFNDCRVKSSTTCLTTTTTTTNNTNETSPSPKRVGLPSIF